MASKKQNRLKLNTSGKFSEKVYRNKWAIVIWLFTIVAFRGVSLVQQNTGLDPSWLWMTLEAGRRGSFGSGDFLWTHGPLFFLDTQQSFWPAGLYLSLSYRILAITFLYFAFYKHLMTSGHNKYTAVLFSFCFVNIAVQYFNSTFLLVLTFLIFAFFPKSRIFDEHKVMLIGGILLSIFFFNKVNYFIMMAVILAKIIFEKNEYFRRFLFGASAFLIGTLALAWMNNFGASSLIKYVRASYEFTVGYKEMGIGHPSQGIQYLLILNVFLLVTYLLLGITTSTKNITMFAILSYIMFSYGFVRHDGHSRATFNFFFLLAIVLSFGLHRINGYLALTAVLVITSFTSGSTVTKHLGIKELNFKVSGYFGELHRTNLEKFTTEDRMRLSLILKIPQQILSTIGRKEVSILPFDQVAGYAYGFNLNQPPVGQFYAAYTPWLDSQNESFFNAESAPDFILLGAPSAIDGRNFWWEAPRTQLAIFCNYGAALETENWLLLQERPRSICNHKTKKPMPESGLENYRGIEFDEFVVLGNLEFMNPVLERLVATVFKPRTVPIVNFNGRSYRVVGKNNRDLILSVPMKIDYPGVWAIGRGSYPEGVNLKQLRIDLIPLDFRVLE